MASASTRGLLADLLRVLGRPGPLLILPHDNPDPDAMASAVTLKYLVNRLLEKEAHIVLGGIVGRAENRAMRTYLNITLVPVSEVAFDDRVDVALVDTQPGRSNNSLPDGVVPTVVIDHHPAYAEYPGVPFLDLRDQYGATSTMSAEPCVLLREFAVISDQSVRLTAVPAGTLPMLLASVAAAASLC